MRKIHERMPVILSPDEYDMWLSPENHGVNMLKALLKPCDSDLLEAYPVSRDVNKPANNTAELIKPIMPG